MAGEEVLRRVGQAVRGPVGVLTSLGRWGCAMSIRWGELAALVVFLLTVPVLVFRYFTSPVMGYPQRSARAVANVLALAGLALLPLAIRRKPPGPASGNASPVPDKAGT